jgi:hypothetical protein
MHVGLIYTHQCVLYKYYAPLCNTFAHYMCDVDLILSKCIGYTPDLYTNNISH